MENTHKNHGGARQGAGRKAKKGETKVIRVPVLFENAINQLIEHLSNQSKTGIPELETTVFLRDLLQRPINLEIKTKLKNLK